MKRGRDLLAVGDIASARLILARLADSGEADASLLLAGTFDPVQLARLHLRGAVPDVDKAREWYKKAAAQGSSEAGRHLQQSASR
jgi:TPR repeat protein